MRPPVCATCKHDLADHCDGRGCTWTGGALRCSCTAYVAPRSDGATVSPTVMSDTRERLEAAIKRIAALETKLLDAFEANDRVRHRCAELEREARASRDAVAWAQAKIRSGT